MLIKFLIDEDFINYKKPSMFIGAGITCSLKCDKECGEDVCQNSSLLKEPIINYDTDKIFQRYLNNPITSAIVIGGLEPFDSWPELNKFVQEARQKTQDDIVIYTGYYEGEITEQIKALSVYPNIIVKFGRFVPHSSTRIDEVLGVQLASANQYAKCISEQ